jgi:dihydrodipicolinate synthase/N-acetylneuraminate lyase
MSMEPIRAGVHVAAITPFTQEGAIDAPYFARLLAHFEAHGAQGVVVAGSTGEGPSLSAPEKAQLYELAVQAKDGCRLSQACCRAVWTRRFTWRGRQRRRAATR